MNNQEANYEKEIKEIMKEGNHKVAAELLHAKRNFPENTALIEEKREAFYKVIEAFQDEIAAKYNRGI